MGEIMTPIQCSAVSAALLGVAMAAMPASAQDDRFVAMCHVDDDPDFDWNQETCEIRSSSVAFIVEDCAAIARSQVCPSA